jgi:polyhydroxyalkanoate synthesis regulator phasin
MAQNDMLKRYLDAGIAFTNMSRARAKGIIDDLVKNGDIQRDQAQSRVEELVERSRRNTEALVDMVRKELQQQLASMGLATKADIARLEDRITAVAARAPKPAAARPAPAPAPTATKKAGPAAKKGAVPAKKAAGAKKA